MSEPGNAPERDVPVSAPASVAGLARRAPAACRHRAPVSQEQLAARAEVRDRTVRGLESGPGAVAAAGTMRLLADAPVGSGTG
jgi:hypothetical protein